ncbi:MULTISPECIES: hypothetical protein [Streptomyces]|uniref:hypothetical protein n=1 Tax=Streptomyces TaxID=1883 RepID=UPI000696E8A9|nr:MULTISPECIES: hypothetical protein [unclassified Streptomyces]UJV40224.1 hypothetical protein CVT30_10495 [Streptomyces sp. AMCC400023]SFN26467.1 hypothetical protein SAMN04487980_101537 [Streptomyces sp. cf124]
MPHTPDRSDRRDGEFADLFARRTRIPLRGFLPGRRVWKAIGGSAAAVLVIAGTVTAVAAVDWGGDASGKVTTAADKPADEQSVPGDTKKAAVDPSPTDRAGHGAKDKGKDDPDVVYVPVSGGAGAGTGGTEKSASDTDDRSDSGGTTGGTSGSTGTTGSTGTEEKKSTTTQNTDSGSTSGYLWADGSVEADTNDFWDESTVTVKSTEPITSLKVVVRIIQTGGVKSTGTWTSLGDKAAVGQNASSDQIGYVITLKSGVTLAPGTYVFKVQYDHAQGRRDAGRDLYTVTAVANGSDDESLSGRF